MGDERHRCDAAEVWLIGFMTRTYYRLLDWNLHHPLLAVGAVVFLFTGACGIVAQSFIGPLNGQRPILNFKFSGRYQRVAHCGAFTG